MKNLRKVLAVVLVICMAFSLMAVASAKTDFSDQASINYKEAVDVASSLGIMVGDGGTAFAPTGTFTREMAAKVICFILLGKTISESLSTSTSSFKDVAPTRWSAPYIEYGVTTGIIAGMGDGTFAPTAPVTGSQFAKMLLVALGYGQKGEFTGASWEIQAIVKAQAIGILDTGVNYSAAATREQVAKYVFNVLTKASCNTATYSAVTGTYTVGTQTLGLITFGLTRVDTNTNGVAGHHFTAVVAGLVKVISATYTTDNVIATSTNGTSVTNLTNPGPFFKAALDTPVTYFVNGTAQAFGVVDTAADVTGVVVKLIDNDFDGLVDKILVTQKTVGAVSGAVTVNATTGAVTIPGLNGNVAFAKNTVVYPSDLAKFDVVLWYLDNVGVTHVEKAAMLTGTPTGTTSGSKLVFNDNVSRAESGLTGTETIAGFSDFYKEITIWVDDNGNIVQWDLVDTTANANYLVLIDAVDIGFTVQAKVVNTSGVASTVTVATLGGLPTTAGALDALANTFFSYSVNTDGTYALTAAANTNQMNAAISNVAKFDGVHTGNSSTVFIVPNALLAGGPGYTVFTGVANAPKFDNTTDTNMLVFGTTAKYVYVYAGVSTAVLPTNNVYFIDVATFTHVIAFGATPEHYVTSAIVNGEAVTVKLTPAAFAAAADGLFAVQSNAAGYITDSDGDVTGDATGTAITSVGGGTLVLGGTNAFTYNDSTVVYFIAGDGSVTKGTAANIVVDTNDVWTTVLTPSLADADDLLAAVYISVQ